MTRKSSDIIEDLVNSLEKLIDTLDDEWHHNDEGEWRQADNIRANILPLAKEKFKMHLDEYIDRRIETFTKVKDAN
jgi:thiamine phosphate synthase YjbQ (UPF0047 family)